MIHRNRSFRLPKRVLAAVASCADYGWYNWKADFITTAAVKGKSYPGCAPSQTSSVGQSRRKDEPQGVEK